jgi:hypothetical protein
MPEQIRFNGNNFEVIDAINGHHIASGHTPQDIARIMTEKYAMEHPHHQSMVYSDYYNVVLQSAQLAVKSPNTDIAIYDRKNNPALTPPPVPKGYESWERVSDDIWRKDMPSYRLTVQFYNGAYYSTVTDIENYRVYSNAIPFRTVQEAMNAASTTVSKLAHQFAKPPVRRDVVSTSRGNISASLGTALMNIPSLVINITDPKLRTIVMQIADKLKESYRSREISLQEVDSMRNELSHINYRSLSEPNKKAITILDMVLTDLRAEIYTVLNAKPESMNTASEEYKPIFHGNQGRLF